MATANVEQQADEPRYTFVPDDVCVIVTNKTDLDDASRGEIYEAVWQALYDAPDRGNLPPLEKREGTPTFFFGDEETGGIIAHLYYRQRVPEGLSDAARADSVRSTVVALNTMYAPPNRTINIFQRAKNPALRNLTVAAVAPHWLGVGCGSGGDGDGPAAPPEPVGPSANANRPDNWRFRFARPDRSRGDTCLQGFVEAARLAAAGDAGPSNIVVAILDTCPTNAAIHWALGQFTGNSLLGQIGDPTMPKPPPRNQVSVEGSVVDTAFEFDLVREILPMWSGRMDPWLGTLNPVIADDPHRLKGLRETEYAMPDHGLFVAGIIKDIAPTAEIHLVRALEDAGVTTLVAFVRTLCATLDQPWANRANTHLILSLSLTFSVPTYDEFKRDWAGALGHLEEGDKATIYMHIHRNLKDVIAALAKRNVLVVAAVGNYNQPGAARPEPRYPAIYDSVLAVAAVSREEQAARYTNRGDTVAPSGVGNSANGIATFGGDITLSPSPPIIVQRFSQLLTRRFPLRGKRLNRIIGPMIMKFAPKVGGSIGLAPDPTPPTLEQEPQEEPDAIRGLYSTTALPLASSTSAGATTGGNTTGWVLWVGTSFATPIIAGVAALLWEDESRKNPNVVVRASAMIGIVQGYADTRIATQADLGCDTIFAEQELIP